jgi:hypothetical protein
MTGAPAACPPPPYSADESGCAPIATRRCEDYKASMKPRVAESAVACLLALTPAQRCDARQVDQCGHRALMNACMPAPPAPVSGFQGAAAGVSAAATPGDDLESRCKGIVQSCAGTSQRECEGTLAGMTSVGRERTARCVASHCSDKGLLGCEALEAK